MCNCEEKKYNINFGCCVPIVANADAYYTKSEIDEKIDDIVSSGCCITPEEVDEKIANATDGLATEQWVEDKHYITGVDLSDYALKEEIPDISGYATEQWVNDQGFLKTHQSLEGYATENWVQSQGYLTQHQDLSDYALKSEIPDISGLASETYVRNYTYDKATIDEKITEGGIFDPTQYYTKTQVDNAITAATDGMATQTWVNNQGFLKEHQSLEGYATEAWVEGKGYLTEHQDLSSYALKSEIPDISGKLDISVFSTYSANTNTTINGKQDKLSAGTGVEIVNNTINVTGGSVTVDQTLNSGSTNAIANSAVTNAINAISAKTPIDGYVSAVTASRSSTTVSVDTYKNGGHVTNTISFPKINGTGIVGNTDNYQLATQANFTAHTGDSTVHVTSTEKNTWNSKVDSSTLNNYLLKSKIWCGTQSQYDAITTKDAETLYLIHS